MLESNRIIPPAIDAFVHDLVRAHAEQDPDLQAICASDGNLTYGELEDLSSQLATRLVTQGVGPEVTVPLCFEKSKWAIVGLLGTLKAGGAFALLDPSQPVARLEYFVKQAGATFVLSSSACLGTCQNLVERSIVVDAEAFLNPKKASVHSSAKLNNAAYIIFTSGSTGVPKAVISRYLSEEGF
jgi:non-ribosomal peptide synthetase component F